MDIRSRSNKLFYSIGGIFLVFAVCFLVYQYHREREYKIDIMHSRLQMYNYELMQTLGDSILSPRTFYAYVRTHDIEGIRVTLISHQGEVLLDSKQHDVTRLKNHLHRTEVQQAIKEGNGYDIKRASESTGQTYFYSATKTSPLAGRVFIIRTAIPYSTELTASLRPDYTPIIFTLILIVMVGMALFLSTSHIGRRFGNELKSVEEDRERIKRQLTQNAAHELKTPTASIHGYLESIIENPDMDPEQRQHFLERCYAQSERMARLLKDMSTLTRLDEIPGTSATGQNAFTAEVDVAEIIHNVLDDTRLQLEERGITPTVTLIPSHGEQGGALMVKGDPHLIYSIFRNLVDNTIAYATGATTIKIACEELISTDEGHRIYEFQFSDDGPGVEPKHLFHLFERFYRVDKGRSRKLGGTGLGLAIVKNAVMAHGGTCNAEQTPGGGLTIRFNLIS